MHSSSQLHKAEASTFFWRVCWATCSSKSNLLNTHLCVAKRSHAIQKRFKASKNIWNTQQGTTELLFLLHLFTATFHLWFSEELEEGIEERHLRLNDSSWPEYNDSQMAANFTARTLHRIRVVRVQTHESDDNMMLGGVLLMEEESGEENRNGLMLNSINIKNSWEKRVWSIKISRQRRKCRRVGWMWPWGWLT